MYEIVDLTNKTIIGLKTRTNNSDASMHTKINQLWGNFFSNQTLQENQSNPTMYGVYTNYERDVNGDYDLVIGYEGKPLEMFASVEISSGKYAKFNFEITENNDITKAWQTVWETDLPRAYSTDFEAYISKTQVAIYIALK